MSNFEQIQERLISGKGVLKIPESALDSRVWIMYADVVRKPKNEYQEFNWNPPQSLYARMTYLRGGYVQTSDYLKFTREQRVYINDISGQNLRAIKCAYEGILQTFFNLGNALQLPSISITNAIKDYESLSLSWDEIRFSCYADTALQIRFFKLSYDVCNAENDDSKRPPAPPPPLPPVPPGTPIGSISNPYDEDTNDNGNTQPFPGDDFEEQPVIPQPCDKVRVTVKVTFANGTTGTVVGVGGTGELQYAPIVGANVLVQGSTTRARVQGGAAVGTVACDGSTNFQIVYANSFNPGNPITNAEIINIEIVP